MERLGLLGEICLIDMLTILDLVFVRYITINLQLKNIKTPTLIINGSEDPLIPIDHAFALSKGISSSKLYVMEGVGHELPEELMEEISKRMLNNFYD